MKIRLYAWNSSSSPKQRPVVRTCCLILSFTAKCLLGELWSNRWDLCFILLP